MTDLLALAESLESYDPKLSPDNLADELEIHQDVVLATGLGGMSPRFEATFVRSLDAAITLVPKGLSFEVRASGTGDKGQATVWDPMRVPGDREWRVTGCASPALALTAACLRALAAQSPRMTVDSEDGGRG